MDGDREIRYGQSTEEVSAMPEETAADENAQPEEEDEAEILNAGIRQGIMEQVGDMVNFLERGRIQLGDREHAFAWLAGARGTPCANAIPSGLLS